MKKKISVLTFAVLFILGLSIASPLDATLVNYLGKTTWLATITDHTTPSMIGQTFTITGGVSKVGDEFYLFQGYVTFAADDPIVLSGSGFQTGNTLIFTMCMSQNHTTGSTQQYWRDGGVVRASMDKTSQDGTFYDIGHDFNTSTRTFRERFTAATLTRTGSPIPLGAGLAPQQLLLLD
ncbi:MAG: hypothetical protein AB1424_08025 [Thermodesulfobacteriota bacterium]